MRLLLALALAAEGVLCHQDPLDSPLNQLMQAEDRRGSTEADILTLRDGPKAEGSSLRRAAVRALGRLERADLLPDILPLLEDADASVRAAATIAVAQALSRGPGGAGFEPLRVSMTTDPDASVAGAAATSIGRLRYADNEAARQAEAALLGSAQEGLALLATSDLVRPEAGERIAQLLGIARGLEALFRLRPDLTAPPETFDLWVELAALGRDDANDPWRAQVRFLAVSAMVNARAELTDELLLALQRDPHVGVRRLAAGVIGSTRDYGSLLVARALQDSEGRVRYELLRTLSRRVPERGACSRLLAGLRDAVAAVRLLTIDALAGCDGAIATLERIASNIEAANEADWHEPAHALVALATMNTALARPHAESAGHHPTWQMRMYAAHAATASGWVDLLRLLAADEQANVASIAIPGLSAAAGHGGDELYLNALASDDGQLLMAAAAALTGGEQPVGEQAVEQLLAALQRVTALERETSRDPRRALLEAIGSLGSADQAEAVGAYLRDFDPVIANTAADVLEQWTGRRPSPDPQPLPPSPFPSAAEIEDIEEIRAVVRMQSGDEFALRLYPFDAPSNAARFVRLAREGYFDGLTFHRVVPNFVIQGGSPGANEFAGDGPYTRDEITDRSHRRGTVGISTRGRDTGDAQIFVNLIDNVRLDFNYTIFAEVIEGMDAVEAILEGTLIDTVLIERAQYR